MTATAINANQTTASAILGNDTNGSQSSVTPQEIGMMFVHEYYNFLHDDPQKLHLFYNKNSTYLHGEEGDLNVKLVNGNQVSKYLILT
jgi:Nuclear transport factor 2 (NTF2) domain